MLKKKVMMITGCSGGLGAALAKRSLDQGHIVYATIRDLSRLGELQALEHHPDLHLHCLDVCDRSKVEALITTIGKSGGLDALILNAGVHFTDVIEHASSDRVASIFNTNFYGALNCIQAALPAMRARRAGLIVGISSLSAQIALPGDGIYAASKAALEKMLESLRFEVAPFGVNVSVIVPSSFQSSLLNTVVEPCVKASAYEKLLVHLAEEKQTESAITSVSVAEVVLDLVANKGGNFRIPTDERAKAILEKIVKMSENERTAAIASWSDAAWWA